MKNSQRDTLGERMKALLELVPTTAYALSVAIGKKGNYIRDVRDGNNKKPIPLMFDYLRICYNVNPDWLRTGDGDMFLDGGMKDQTVEANLFLAMSKLSDEDKVFFTKVIEAMLYKELHEKEE